MAGLALTELQGRINNYVQDGLDKYERLESSHGAMMMFADDTKMIPSGKGILSGDSAKNIAEQGYAPTAPKIPFIKRDNITVGTGGTTTCFATSVTGESILVDVTYNTIDFNMIIPMEVANHNYVGWDDNFGIGLQERMIAARAAINATCLSTLESNKNQIQAGNLMGYFVDSGTNEFDVPLAKVDQKYNFERSLMTRLKFVGHKPYRVLGNEIEYAYNVFPNFNQGQGNDTNQQWQYGQFGLDGENFANGARDLMWYQDTELVDAVGVQGTSFVVPSGSLALINSIDSEYYDNAAKKAKIEKLASTEIFSTELPGFPAGFKWGVKHKAQCNTGREDESWQFEAKYATIVPHVVDPSTEVGAIQKIQALNA